MTRLFACLAAAAVLAGCGLAAAPEKSDAAVLVGIGEQDASMFTDPLFTQARLQARALLPVVERGAEAGARPAGSTSGSPARRPPARSR